MPSKILSESDPNVQQHLGKTFNRLTAVRFVGNHPKGYGQIWEFDCSCGGSKTTLIKSVLKGLTGSCGCLHREITSARNRVHGFAGRGQRDPIYIVWKGMMSRCNDLKDKDYGGRGIAVCAGWKNFKSFYDDMAATYQRGLTIERDKNEFGYSCGHCEECLSRKWPTHCYWATRLVQNRNKRNNTLLTMNGETHPISEWHELLGLGGNSDIIYVRLARGWSVERALTTPPIPPSSKHSETYDFSRP